MREVDTLEYTMMIYEVIDILSPPILVGVTQVMSVEKQMRTKVVKMIGK